jgi:hypothetical protein
MADCRHPDSSDLPELRVSASIHGDVLWDGNMEGGDRRILPHLEERALYRSGRTAMYSRRPTFEVNALSTLNGASSRSTSAGRISGRAGRGGPVAS